MTGNELEQLVMAFGAPAGFGIWFVWQWMRTSRSGDSGASMTGKLDAIQSDVSDLKGTVADLREKVANIQGHLNGMKG